jgi:hypothetical protein
LDKGDDINRIRRIVMAIIDPSGPLPTDSQERDIAVELINSYSGKDLSAPLTKAVKTVAKNAPLSWGGSMEFVGTNEAVGIAVALRLAVEAMKTAREIIDTRQDPHSGDYVKVSPAEFVEDVQQGRIIHSASTRNYVAVGDLGIVEAAGNIAAEHNGSIPQDVKAALKTLAEAGGMKPDQADKAITQLEKGEQEIASPNWSAFVPRPEGFTPAAGQADVNAAVGLLKVAVANGLTQDIAKNVAALPTPQQDASDECRECE